MKYASFKMWIADKYHYKEGYAIGLVVRKNNKRKVMALGIYAESHQRFRLLSMKPYALS